MRPTQRPVACSIAAHGKLREAGLSRRKFRVLPGDLALRKAVQVAYQLDHLPTQQEVLAIAERWRPYRSLATSYLFSVAFQRIEAPPVVPHET